MRQLLVAAGFAFLALLTAGCGTRVAQVRGVAPLNRNPLGESTPVDVRFYALRRDQAFAAAGFAQLWTDPARSLGGDLIGEPVVATLLPGAGDATPQVVVLPAAGDAAWIGVQLLARQEDALPRTLLIPAERLAGSLIEASGYGLRLAVRQ
jgi:type VI secretion system VasD/TssJ family lipoprotein